MPGFTEVPDKATLAAFAEGDWDTYIRDNLNAGVMRTIDVNATPLDIVNGAAENTIYSYEIPAGILGLLGRVEMQVFGDWLNASGSSRGFTFRVYVDGVARFADSTGDQVTDPDRGPVMCRARLMNCGAADSNYLTGRLAMGNRHAGDAGAGLGNIGAADPIGGQWGSTGKLAVDTTAAVTLAMTIQLSAVHAQLSFRKHYACVDYYPFG